MTTTQHRVAKERVMKAKSVLIALSLLALAGCRPDPIRAHADQYAPSQLNFIDQDLRDNTAIGQIKVTFDDSKLLHIDVPIRATTSLPLYTDYRVSFVDANGLPLGPPTAWTAVRLPSNDFQDILLTSSSPRAADFRLDLRDAR
jgi:uncharacterized protein YcfL